MILPGEEKEVLISTKHLNESLPESNPQAFSLIEKEINYFLEVVRDFYEIAFQSMTQQRSSTLGAIEKYETLADLLDEKIEGALMTLSQRELTENEAKRITLLVRISNQTEQLADTVKNLGTLPLTAKISSQSLSPEAQQSTENIFSRLREPLQVLAKGFPGKIENYNKVHRSLNSIDALIDKGYKEHVRRLRKRQARGGSFFVESSSLIEGGTEQLKELLSHAQHYSRLK
jgi:phosphate:Na+ symporter